jgi:hypothetical protein
MKFLHALLESLEEDSHPVSSAYGAVCGAQVTDEGPAIRRIIQGTTFRQLGEAGVRLLTLVKP